MDSDTPTNSTMPSTPNKKNLLEELQTEEQRRVLDTVARVRKCGLEGTLSLPQIVVCGDQSSGKSSVLEALTEIPFPRNDNLCTRYATEISLRNASSDSITIRVIPDTKRPTSEQTDIGRFEKSITDFDDLPSIMNDAMVVMGIGGTDDEVGAKPRAFARDVLSIVYSGPDRPQLTLVDIPGLIGAKTKATTTEDIGLVAEITQHYIDQPRTICLAVVSATTDYANQTILERVREVDPKGARTLGVITKPDAIEAGSGHEKAYIELAQNSDIFFELGWHVVKNRKFEERNFTLAERKQSEDHFFRTSNWSCLPSDSVGIDALRSKLSVLLFEHVKKELPNLREELETTLSNTQNDLEQLGCPRSSSSDCHKYLTQLSLEVWKTCKSAIDGHYEGSYFHQDIDLDFSLSSDSTIRRARAVVQAMNSNFADNLRQNGQKFQFENKEAEVPCVEEFSSPEPSSFNWPPPSSKRLSRKEGLEWVRKALIFNRGKELVGNFNPLIVGELFFELSEKWGEMATCHVNSVANVCMRFLKALLQNKCPEDVERKIWMTKFEEELQSRHNAATAELKQLMQDLKQYPINYNHYYTDTIAKRRQDRQKEQLTKHLAAATTRSENYISKKNVTEYVTEVDVEKAIANYSQNVDPNMDNFSCEEALDCLFAIYKVSQKTFVANVTIQVIERHIIRGLEEIFSPMYVAGLTSEQAEALASEPLAAKRKREYLTEQIKKLEEGRQIFRSVL